MEASRGDMRKAVTYMQTCHQLSAGSAIAMDDVLEVSGQVPDVLSCYTLDV